MYLGVKNRLKEIRMREHMLSSKDFAKMLGVNYTTYSNWETGISKPTLDAAFQISQKLNKKVDEIWYSE